MSTERIFSFFSNLDRIDDYFRYFVFNFTSSISTQTNVFEFQTKIHFLYILDFTSYVEQNLREINIENVEKNINEIKLFGLWIRMNYYQMLTFLLQIQKQTNSQNNVRFAYIFRSKTNRRKRWKDKKRVSIKIQTKMLSKLID